MKGGTISSSLPRRIHDGHGDATEAKHEAKIAAFDRAKPQIDAYLGAKREAVCAAWAPFAVVPKPGQESVWAPAPSVPRPRFASQLSL